MNGTDKSLGNGDRDIREDIRDMRNDIERIKSDTHNINRIMTLANIDTILTDLKNLIGKSEVKAAILHLTRERIGMKELSDKLGLDPRNLSKFINPFVDNKTYVNKLKENGKVYYLRAEIIDLINFEQQELFAPLLESWRSKQSQGAATTTPSPQESALAEEGTTSSNENPV